MAVDGVRSPVTVAGPRRTRTGFLAPARDVDLSAVTVGSLSHASADGVNVDGQRHTRAQCDRPLAGARRARAVVLTVARCPPVPSSDACPGVFAPHDAADGALARIRLPGGVIGAAALRVVADCAQELGDGRVHLTSRGNLQLRGLSRSGALAARLAAAGLLPSATHERVRNVLASPLAGITCALIRRAAGVARSCRR